VIITILLTLLALIATGVLILVISPFRARLYGFYDGVHVGGSATLSFLHPRVLRAEVAFASGTVEVRILGWKPGRKKEKSSGAEADDESYDEPYVEPAGVQEAASRILPVAEDSGSAFPAASSVPVYHDAPIEKTAEIHEATVLKVEPAVEMVQINAPARVNEPESKDSYRIPPEVHFDTTAKTADPLSSPKAATSESKSESEKEKVAPAAEKKDNWFEKLKRNIVVHFIRNSGWRNRVLGWVLRFLKSLFSLVKFDKLRLEVTGGVEDPMITGTLAGYMYAIGAILTQHDRYHFTFEPVFMKNSIAGSLQFRVTTSLFMLLFPMVAAVVTFPWIRTLLVWLSYRRMKKRFSNVVAA